MDVKQLSYFLETAKCLHFSKAAENLGIAQSALSQQIKILETSIGCRLFDRSNKWRVSLTDAGKAFAEDSEKIITQIEYAKRRASLAARGDIGRLSVYTIPSFFSSVQFFKTIKAMQKKLPNVFFKLSKHSSANIFNGVETGKIDFGVIRAESADGLDLSHIYLGREKIMLVISETHRLASKRVLHMSDLRDEKIIMMPYEESPFFNQIILRAFRNSGILSPLIAQEIYNFDAVMKIVPNSDYVSFVPELLKSQKYYKGVVIKPVADLVAETKYIGIWRSENKSMPLKNFLSLLRREFRV